MQIKRRVYADKPQFYALLLQLALLGYIALTAIAASCMRIDISIIGQFEPAPRYFFYPYIALSFFLCWLGYHSNQLGKIVILALLTMAFANNIGKYSRPHDVMDWRSQVKACLEGQDGYHFKIFFDGHKDRTWDMYMTTAQCKQLMGKD
ncbi:MAG: hypothetical protein HWD59_08590 [Coxiellaceae bacterium]|nr:MAG: hypothetical protein HWD59_08590 [Coxiellaceae bacterium]